jgi:hypothetical protein
MFTQTIAGHRITLIAGVRYQASRPFATRGRKEFPVTIESIDFTAEGIPSLVIDKLNYEAADALVCAFNNGPTSFDGRVWGGRS